MITCPGLRAQDTEVHWQTQKVKRVLHLATWCRCFPSKSPNITHLTFQKLAVLYLCFGVEDGEAFAADGDANNVWETGFRCLLQRRKEHLRGQSIKKRDKTKKKNPLSLAALVVFFSKRALCTRFSQSPADKTSRPAVRRSTADDDSRARWAERLP